MQAGGLSIRVSIKYTQYLPNSLGLVLQVCIYIDVGSGSESGISVNCYLLKVYR